MVKKMEDIDPIIEKLFRKDKGDNRRKMASEIFLRLLEANFPDPRISRKDFCDALEPTISSDMGRNAWERIDDSKYSKHRNGIESPGKHTLNLYLNYFEKTAEKSILTSRQVEYACNALKALWSGQKRVLQSPEARQICIDGKIPDTPEAPEAPTSNGGKQTSTTTGHAEEGVSSAELPRLPPNPLVRPNWLSETILEDTRFDADQPLVMTEGPWTPVSELGPGDRADVYWHLVVQTVNVSSTIDNRAYQATIGTSEVNVAFSSSTCDVHTYTVETGSLPVDRVTRSSTPKKYTLRHIADAADSNDPGVIEGTYFVGSPLVDAKSSGGEETVSFTIDVRTNGGAFRVLRMTEDNELVLGQHLTEQKDKLIGAILRAQDRKTRINLLDFSLFKATYEPAFGDDT